MYAVNELRHIGMQGSDSVVNDVHGALLEHEVVVRDMANCKPCSSTFSQ